jgi:hypothetical protein
LSSFLSNDDLENVAPSFDAKDLFGLFVLGAF